MSSIAVNAITDAAGGNTASINGATPTNDNLMGRNRIINGDMRIHQRGGAITSGYTLDRFGILNTTDGAISVTQDTDAPNNFVNSLKVSVTTADASLASTQRLAIRHRIEGNNIADFGFGSASAKNITLSFWVKSSVTGTYGGSFQNSATNRTYVFSYTISSANTWEQKTVSLSGDTSGTWATDNTEGLCINWSLGCGSSFLQTAGSWLAADAKSVTGEDPLVGTLNATWYITGVQLEAGSVATPFERRQYGQELALCQRYYFPVNINTQWPVGFTWSTNRVLACVFFPANMRTNPTATMSGGITYYWGSASSVSTSSSISLSGQSSGAVSLDITVTATAGTAGGIRLDSPILLSAEL